MIPKIAPTLTIDPRINVHNAYSTGIRSIHRRADRIVIEGSKVRGEGSKVGAGKDGKGRGRKRGSVRKIRKSKEGL